MKTYELEIKKNAETRLNDVFTSLDQKMFDDVASDLITSNALLPNEQPNDPKLAWIPSIIEDMIVEKMSNYMMEVAALELAYSAESEEMYI